MIWEKHPNIDLFGINFASMRGYNVVDPNDGSTLAPTVEAEEEWDDSKNAEDMKDALDAELITSNPAKDPSSIEVNAPLSFIVDDIPFPLL